MAPSERSAFHAPSYEQLEQAKELGIKIPDGTSCRGVEVLIDRAFKVQARETIAREGLKPGVLIRRKSTGATYEVLSVNKHLGTLEYRNERSWDEVDLVVFSLIFEVIRR